MTTRKIASSEKYYELAGQALIRHWDAQGAGDTARATSEWELSKYYDGMGARAKEKEGGVVLNYSGSDRCDKKYLGAEAHVRVHPRAY